MLHSSGTREHQSLIVRHPVLSVLGGSASDFPIHSRLVAPEKCEIVTCDQHFRELQLAPGRTTQRTLSLCKPVQRSVMTGDGIPKRHIRKSANHFFAYLNCSVILACAHCDPAAHNRYGVEIVGISLDPRFESLQLLLQVSRYLP